MELKINQIALPEKVTFNDEEIETALSEKLEELRTVVYTDDQIKDAKAERAKWNSLKKALNDEKIRVKKDFMAPIEDFEKKIRHFCDMIDDTVGLIDKQVKDYESRKREEKADRISEIWAGIQHPDWLDLGDIYNDRWLNATYKLEQVEEDLKEKCSKIIDDLLTIEALPEFSFEAKEEYKRTLDLAGAIREGQRLAEIQKRKAEELERRKAAEEEETRRAEEAFRKAEEEMHRAAAEDVAAQIINAPVTPKKVELREWVSFSAYMTYEEAFELKKWLQDRGIEIRRAK